MLVLYFHTVKWDFWHIIFLRTNLLRIAKLQMTAIVCLRKWSKTIIKIKASKASKKKKKLAQYLHWTKMYFFLFCNYSFWSDVSIRFMWRLTLESCFLVDLITLAQSRITSKALWRLFFNYKKNVRHDTDIRAFNFCWRCQGWDINSGATALFLLLTDWKQLPLVIHTTYDLDHLKKTNKQNTKLKTYFIHGLL